MARFNKAAHLRQNIDAIKVAFTLDRENREVTPGGETNIAGI